MRIASLFILLSIFLLNAADAAPRPYWIVFGGHQPRDPVYLMKISSDGDTLVPPTAVLKPHQYGSESGAAAIAHFGQSKLHLWRWGKDRVLYHALIDKQRMAVDQIQRIDGVSTTDADTLQVTQRLQNNVLIYESSNSQLMGISINESGIPAGAPWRIIRGVPRQNDEACLSADGRIIVSNRHDAKAPSDKNDRVFTQMLKSNGKPRGTPRQIAAAQDIEACDVSIASHTGTHWVAYIIDHGTDPEDILVLQKVSDDGSRAGDSIIVYSSHRRNQDDQNIALDPRRKFVVFTVDGETFGCEDRDVLVYLRLGLKGRPVGAPRLLAGCGLVSGSIVNVDILRD